MIRAVAIVSLVGLLVLVLYLPLAHPPEKFLAHLRAEHAAATDFGGSAPAMHALERALSLQDSTHAVASIPTTGTAPSGNAVDSAVAREMASVNRRLFDNIYFRSIDALLMLAAFRLGILLEWLPWLLAFTTAVIVDGYVVRIIKAYEFRQHDPELFALAVCGAMVVVCGAAIALVVPVTVPPVLLASVPLGVSLLLGLALASFHLRP